MPTMAPASPAVPEDGPRAYAARISDGGDDGDEDDNDDNDFGGEYLPLVALAGIRGGPGRNENHPGPRGRKAESRNQRSMSTGSIGSNGDQRHLDFGSPPPCGATGLDAKVRRTRSGRARRFAARSPSEGESSREDTSSEEGLGFHATRYPLANSDRLFPSSQASTSDSATQRLAPR